MIKKPLLLICFTITLASACFCAQRGQAAPSAETGSPSYPVRVAVINGAPEIVLKINGPSSIYALPLLEPLRESGEIKKAVIKPTQSGILMGPEPFNVYGVRIKAAGAADIYVNGRRFRGEVDIIRTEKVKLLVVNHVDIEDYLAGVLYHEVSHFWPMEALKAQAIASRTFAVYRAIESIGRDYDLTSDIYSQVYGGRTSERYRTTRAVKETRGKILSYRGKVLPSYFHATCGGRTEDASLLWNIDIPPLKGRQCNYCGQSPHFKWAASVPLQDIEKALNESGVGIKDIKDIKVLSRDSSLRADSIEIIGSPGAEKIPANKFRLAIGPNLLKSANFEVVVRNNTAVFNGRGWGHGAGMCQWGAYYMSKKGMSAEEILKFYYPGVVIVDPFDGAHAPPFL